MKTFNHLQAVIPGDFITQLRQRSEDTLLEIYNDYCSKEQSFEEFKFSNLNHNNSLVMQIATCRFINSEIITKLRDFVCLQINSFCADSSFLIHPTCFLRFNLPETEYSDKHPKPLLVTEPHYDHSIMRGFKIKAITFWLALDEVNNESGQLCFFSNQEIIDYFTTPKGGTRYDYNGYLELSQEIDPIIKNGIVLPKIDLGDVIAFDYTVLHGGTKPLSKRRVSFDFRLVPSLSLKEAPIFIRQCFDEINSAYDVFMGNNLIHLGDFLGASRILQKVSKATKNRDLQRVAAAIANRKPDLTIFQQSQTH